MSERNSRAGSDEFFISGENPSPAYPFVKVEYFKRPLEQQNVVAKIIFECLKEIGYPESDVHFLS
ncbi:MAG: hypothetical protein ACLTZT_21265 [Butyricimonas faecalis]